MEEWHATDQIWRGVEGYRDRVRGPDSGEIWEVSPFVERTDAVVKEGGVSTMFSKSI